MVNAVAAACYLCCLSELSILNFRTLKHDCCLGSGSLMKWWVGRYCANLGWDWVGWVWEGVVSVQDPEEGAFLCSRWELLSHTAFGQERLVDEVREAVTVATLTL